MKCTLFVALALIGFVAGNGAWKENREYKYKLVFKSFVKGSNKQDDGVISSVWLTIRPQSDNLLIGQVTQARFYEVLGQASDEQDSNTSERNSEREYLPINKPFKIHLKNGAIQSLSVDRTWKNYQISQLKFVVSHFQLDTKAQNLIESENNHLPDSNTNNAFYMTMEPIANGNCETTYDISRLPEYLKYANRESIQLPELSAGEDVIQIVKNTNFKNCREIATEKEDNNDMNMNIDSTVSLNSRILVTGSLDNYTIQSSVSTSKVADYSSYAYLTLESVKQRNADSYYNYNPRFGNFDNVGSLVYKIDSQNKRSWNRM